MRLIDAEALEKRFNGANAGECREWLEEVEPGDFEEYCYFCYTPEAARGLVKSAPTIDAVPVIHCKDCKFAHMTYDGMTKYCDFFSGLYDHGEAIYLEPGSYCSYGKKKEGVKNEAD